MPCGAPSSRTWMLSCARSLTSFPVESRTLNVTFTRFTSERKVGVCPCIEPALTASTSRRFAQNARDTLCKNFGKLHPSRKLPECLYDESRHSVPGTKAACSARNTRPTLPSDCKWLITLFVAMAAPLRHFCWTVNMPPERKLCRFAHEVLTLLSMLFIVACSKEPGSAPLPVTTANQTLPFHRPSAAGGIAPTATLVPRGIQARARVTARISGNLTADQSQKGDSFVAELDEPLFFEGHIVSPRGSPARGRILAVQPATLSDEGFLRVILD